MRRELRCAVDERDFLTVEAYVTAKRKWRKISDFVRYAVFTEMSKNPAGRHDRYSVRSAPSE